MQNSETPASRETSVETTSGSTMLRELSSERGSAAPYIIAWLFGVPVSVLFLIAIFRTVF